MSDADAVITDRIVVFQAGAIGDTVLASPAIAALRAHFKRTRIEGVGYPERLDLLKACGLLDAVRAIDLGGFFQLFAASDRLSEETGRYLGGADIVVSWISDREGNFHRHVGNAGVERLVIADAPSLPGGDLHAADEYLRSLAPLGICTDRKAVPRLRLKRKLPEALAREILSLRKGRRRLVGMLPGSGSQRKNWSRERFARVARRLSADCDASVAVLLGPAELERGELDFWKRQNVALLANRPLVEVAGIISRTDFFLGCDSGLTHLAAALGRPVLALFGPTDPAVWGPRGSRVEVIRNKGSRGVPGITVKEVLERTSAILR